MKKRPPKEYVFGTSSHDGELVADGRNEVVVLPLTAEGEIIFLIEPSPAFFGEPTLTVPAAVVEEVYDEQTEEFLEEKGEDFGELANSALQKEIGCTANRRTYLGELRPFSTHLWLRSFIWLAQQLEPCRLEDDEVDMLPIERVPLASFETLIAEGRLMDARVIAALYIARDFLARAK